MNLDFDNIQYRIIYFRSPDKLTKDIYVIYPVVKDLDDDKLYLFTESGASLAHTTLEGLHIESFRLLESFDYPPINYNDIEILDMSEEESI